MSTYLSSTGIVFPDTTAQNYSSEKTFSNPGTTHNLQIKQAEVGIITSSTTYNTNVLISANEVYQIICAVNGASPGTATKTFLYPNNTTYTGFFRAEMYRSGPGIGGEASFQNAFVLADLGSPRYINAIVSTRSGSKTVEFTNSYAYYSGYPNWLLAQGISTWNASASNSASLGDSLTSWTNLGTIVFPAAVSGYIFIKRLV